jgi:hypothetical protein
MGLRASFEDGEVMTTSTSWERIRGWWERASARVGRLHVEKVGVGCAVIALVLYLLGSMSVVRGGWGAESFLGWADTAVDAAPFDEWAASGRSAAVALYWWLDSVAFVPAYAMFAALLLAALRRGGERPGRSRSLPLLLLAWLLLALVLVDLVENALGLARVAGQRGWLLGIAGGAAALVCCSLHPGIRQLLRLPREGCRRYARALPPLIVLSLAVGFITLGWSLRQCNGAALAQMACGTHHAKQWLALLVLALLALAIAVWLFGSDAEALDGPDRRAVLRAAIGDMLLRSRYVLVAIGFIAALTLAMDQGRDLLYAMAASPFRQVTSTPRAWLWFGSLVVLLALGLATVALEYTCWLWTRSACQIQPARGSRRKGRENDPATPLVNGFAKNWARALGSAPVVCLVLMHGRVIEDAVASNAARQDTLEWRWPVLTVLGLAFALIAVGTALLWWHQWQGERDREPSASDAQGAQGGAVKVEETEYYSSLSWLDWGKQIGFWRSDEPGPPGSAAQEARRPEKRKYRLLRTLELPRVPFALAAGMIGCRLIDVWPSHATAGWLSFATAEQDFVPSMALAVALFSVALWLCFFGWLSLLEVRRSIPYVGFLVALVGAAGVFGFTDNHQVWPPIAPAASVDSRSPPLLTLLVVTFVLVVLLLALYALVLAVARERTMPDRSPRPVWRWEAAAVVVAVALALLPLGADRWATSRPPAQASSSGPPARPTLDQALARWLTGLYASRPPLGDTERIPVFFVSTEGGGIRAAMWTAFALQHLAQDPQFLPRTFSISGVSGGAVGAAVFRACSIEAAPSNDVGKARLDCLERFARTDMLSPLISAWLFEDVLARVVPTAWCRTPGCGLLSRGAWFEQALEDGAAALRRGLTETSGWTSRAEHVPFLLLNATWVETGERAIASDLQIRWPTFHDAKDQLGLLDTDLPLGTAAHNAARFPFINAIGSLHATGKRCAALEAGPSPAPAGTGSGGAPAEQPESCGHLADGGYFDNSGAQTTLDVLRGFDACLGDDTDPDTQAYPECRALDATARQWLRAHLVPQVLMVHNDVDPTLACADECPFTKEPVSPREATKVDPQLCLAQIDRYYRPERPTCRRHHDLFVGALGPALTLLNVSGIGAGARLAEARQARAVRAVRGRLGVNASLPLPPTRPLDLHPDGTLYPLGWHLSELAIEGMLRQACELQLEMDQPVAIRDPACGGM